MNQSLETFKAHVIEAAQNPNFVHCDWYVEHHLVIVEKIANELCDVYANANSLLVNVLVWLHDYGKIVDRKNERKTTIEIGFQALINAGFHRDFAKQAIYVYEEMERYDKLSSASIEAKIISSADGASHFVGPFYALWWKENPEKSVEQLMADNIRKAHRDWEKKIVLPEIHEAFKVRNDLHLESCGNLPSHFLPEQHN